MQPRYPVVVILHRSKAELRHQLRPIVVDAAHLVDRHLPLLELGGLLVIGKLPQQQFAAGLFLNCKTGGVNGSQPQQKILLSLQLVIHSLH